MITSVYLSNQTVQIVQGERGKGEEKILRAFSVDIPEGSLLNGTIINEQELQSHLKEIWIKYELPKQDIELVVNGTVFGTKSISVPAVKEKKILEMLPMEFVDVERVEDAVYDYMLIEDKKKEKSQELLAVMADKKTIQSYIDLFAQIEVKLDLVSTTYCTVIKLLQHKLPADGNSYIVQLMDGNSIASMLWVDGKYTYTSRKRIFAQRGTEAFGMEVVRNVSQIQQFYASLKNDCPLQKILCCGFSDMDLVVCKDSLEQAEIDLSIGKLDYQYADQGFAVGNLMRAKRDVNFCRMIKSEKKTNKKIDVGYFIPPAIAFGICFAVSAGVMGLQAYESNT
ncbi:MAG: hypothetical protein EOM40_14430 [Clostridia bacterium]|nr:hypothetical protein [Clostridia bacterium]